MKYLLTILVASIALSACNRNTFHYPGDLNCPPYDPTFLHTWFPYEQGQTYYYKDSTGDRHWLAIQGVEYSDGGAQNGCEYHSECLPSGHIFAYRDKDRNDKIWFNVNHAPASSTHRENVTLAWNCTNLNLIVNKDGTLSPDPEYYDRQEAYYQEIKPGFIHYDNISLNEVTYTDVYEIILNNNDMGNAHKFYLAKNHGIIGYETLNGRSYWMEQ